MDRKKHEKAHNAERPFSCNLCEMTFTEKCRLNLHLSKHKQEKQYSCDKCESQFTKTEYLRQHRLRTHENDMNKRKEFVCVQCSKSFTTLVGLTTHVRRLHTTVRPFSCDHCPMKFVDKSDRRKHEIVHSKERPFNCSMCSKSFKRTALLKQASISLNRRGRARRTYLGK